MELPADYLDVGDSIIGKISAGKLALRIGSTLDRFG
jgi:hypothetical protein